MKKGFFLSTLLVAFLVTQAGLAAAANAGASRFTIGTRTLYVRLREPTRDGQLQPGGDPLDDKAYEGRFIGTVREQAVQQEWLPLRPYIQWWAFENFGIGVSYDRLEVDARDNGGSDGILTMSGPIVYAAYRSTAYESMEFFLEAGIGIFETTFDQDAAWYHAGPFGHRVMDVDDPTAVILGAGIAWAIAEHWSIDLYARLVRNTAVDAKAYYSKNADEPFAFGEFVLDYYGLGMGVRYNF